jgi:hypothetical protein
MFAIRRASPQNAFFVPFASGLPTQLEQFGDIHRELCNTVALFSTYGRPQCAHPTPALSGKADTGICP